MSAMTVETFSCDRCEMEYKSNFRPVFVGRFNHHHCERCDVEVNTIFVQLLNHNVSVAMNKIARRKTQSRQPYSNAIRNEVFSLTMNIVEQALNLSYRARIDSQTKTLV